MKNILTALIFLFLLVEASAQVSTVTNQKPLGYLNPAFQNYELNKGVISASYVVNPYTKDTITPAYLGIFEYKINDNMRVGLHSSSYENRLTKGSSHMAYASYKLELEKGNYLILGADVGAYSDEVKSLEYDKVYSPNKYIFGADSSKTGTTSGVEWGLGVAYNYGGFMAGLGFSKINRPAIFSTPIPVYKKIYTTSGGQLDSSSIVADSTIQLSETKYSVETNLNIVYEWDASDNISLTHSVHISSVGTGIFDYASLQNILEYKKRHSIGLGIFNNGSTGFIGSLGVGITENIKLGATTFFVDDLNYDAVTDLYVSDGLKPSIEFNLLFEF